MNKITQIVYKICNHIVRRTVWYNENFWNGATKFWKEKQFGLDVVNLGSTAGVHDFNYKHFKIKGRNWALGPQSLVHDYSILRNYFSYIKEGGFVLIPLCPFSCLISNYDKKHNFKYYTFLHPATILDFDDEERTRALKIKFNPFKEMPFYCIKSTLREFIRKGLHFLSLHKKNDLQLSAETMIDHWKQQFEIDNLDKPLDSKHLLEQQNRREVLQEMVDFIKDRNLIPVIVIMPMHHSLSSHFSLEFKRHYIDDFIDGINCLILDYMYDKDMDKNDYYKTALLLNEKGATIFTEKVLRKISVVQ